MQEILSPATVQSLLSYVQGSYQFYVSLFQSPFDFAAKYMGKHSTDTAVLWFVSLPHRAAQESSSSIKNESNIISTPVKLVMPKTIFVNLCITC